MGTAQPPRRFVKLVGLIKHVVGLLPTASSGCFFIFLSGSHALYSRHLCAPPISKVFFVLVPLAPFGEGGRPRHFCRIEPVAAGGSQHSSKPHLSLRQRKRLYPIRAEGEREQCTTYHLQPFPALPLCRWGRQGPLLGTQTAPDRDGMAPALVLQAEGPWWPSLQGCQLNVQLCAR